VGAGVYDTVFACQRGEIFVLRVDVSRRSELIVQLFGCHAEHPLIGGDMHVRISYHDGNLLGDAVMETIVQMQLDPPKILSFTDEEVKAMQPIPPAAPTPSPDPPAARNYDHPIEGIEIPVATPVPLQQAQPNPSAVDPPTISTLSAGSAGWGFPSQEDRTAQRREASLNAVTGKDQAQGLVMGTTNPSVVSSEHVILVRAEPVPSAADDRMMMDTGHRDSSGGTRLK
jgi:hypothetical protein